MKRSTKDKLEGTLYQAKGTAKQKIGQATSNPTLRAKGAAESIAGRIQTKIGQIEKVLEQ